MGVFMGGSFMSMWIWNGFQLDWKLNREPSEGDNITFDAARNYYVFGWLLVIVHRTVGETLAVMLGTCVVGVVGGRNMHWSGY